MMIFPDINHYIIRFYWH